MSQEIEIVRVEEAYIPDCVSVALKAGQIFHASYQNRLGAELDEKLHAAWRVDEAAAVIRMLQGGDAFVALADGKVVGFAGFAVKGILGAIADNAVAPEYQGKGVEVKLYEAVLMELRKAGCKYASVKTSLDESNAPALEALKQVGFEKNQPGVRYYQLLDLAAPLYPTSSDTVQVIPCEEKHMDECIRIALIAWGIIHESYKKCIGEDIHDALMTGWEEGLAADVKKLQLGGKGYVAIVDGKVAGFASYRTDGLMGVLSRNAVDPEYRGRGIAKLMYGMLMNKIREAGCTYATVHTGLDDGHAGARRAYSKVGFEKNLPYTRYYQEL